VSFDNALKLIVLLAFGMVMPSVVIFGRLLLLLGLSGLLLSLGHSRDFRAKLGILLEEFDKGLEGTVTGLVVNQFASLGLEELESRESLNGESSVRGKVIGR
jgi:hypothetical protein